MAVNFLRAYSNGFVVLRVRNAAYSMYLVDRRSEKLKLISFFLFSFSVF